MVLVVWILGALITTYIYNKSMGDSYSWLEFVIFFILWPMCLSLLLSYMLVTGFETLRKQNTWEIDYYQTYVPPRKQKLQSITEDFSKLESKPLKGSDDI